MRSPFLVSPLGQALLNSSNASINVSEIHGPGGSDVSFDPQLWANRTLNSGDNLPTDSNPEFSRVGGLERPAEPPRWASRGPCRHPTPDRRGSTRWTRP